LGIIVLRTNQPYRRCQSWKQGEASVGGSAEIAIGGSKVFCLASDEICQPRERRDDTISTGRIVGSKALTTHGRDGDSTGNSARDER
jgi:ribonuclease PH